MSKLHSLHNSLGTLKAHIIFSNAPALILIGILPIFSEHFQITLIGLGYLFFVCRSSIILGSYLNKFFLDKFGVISIILFAEVSSALILLTGYLFFNDFNLTSILVFLFLRCFLMSLISNSRNVLFKSKLDSLNCEDIITYTSAISQFFYIFAGVIYILGVKNIYTIQIIIFIDFLSSIISSALLLRLKKYYNYQLIQSKVKTFSRKNINELFSSYKFLILMSLLFSIAFGGSDILCFFYGEMIYKSDVGYGYTTILYSLSFFFGYKLSSKQYFTFKKTLLFVILTSLISFQLLHSNINFYLQNSLFFLIFTMYGFAYIEIEKGWIKQINQEHSSRLFALKDFIISTFLALGEVFYSYFSNSSFLFRICVLIFLAILVSSKFSFHKHQHN